MSFEIGKVSQGVQYEHNSDVCCWFCNCVYRVRHVYLVLGEPIQIKFAEPGIDTRYDSQGRRKGAQKFFVEPFVGTISHEEQGGIKRTSSFGGIGDSFHGPGTVSRLQHLTINQKR